MKSNSNVGILGVGAYLPPEVRTNAWWPESITRAWTEKRAAGRAKRPEAKPATEGMARVMAATEAMKDDPFQGSRERRVMPEGMRSSDMELRAAKEAIERAGIDPQEIGLVLLHAAVPDYLVTNNACLLHHQLGLRPECLSMATDAACTSFVLQLALAEQFIASGRAKYALLVQSCGISRLLDVAEPVSPWFGDGSTAVVVGKVSEGRGILASAQRTEGSLYYGIVASVPQKAWYEEGRVLMYSADQAAAWRTFCEIADRGKEVCGHVLREAGHRPEDVNFFGVHQGTPWARTVTRDHFGLTAAKSVETFAFAASIFAGNIPLALSIGEKEGLLRPDDLLLTFAGGAGLTYGSTLIRWGR